MLIEGIGTAVLLFVLSTMEYRLRRIKDIVPKAEIKELIELKQEAIKVTASEIKEDVARLEKKIDKLIDLQINK